MRDRWKLNLMMVGMLFFCFACDDEKDPEPTPKPGEKAIEDVINALEKIEDVDDFTEALKKIGTVDLENDEVTVFAVKDDTGSTSASVQKEEPATRAGITTTEVKRHIAKGRHNLSSMSGDKLELESIAGDKLIVTKEGSKYLVNGVALVSSSPVTAGNSYIYVVPEIIPAYDPGPEPAVSRMFRFLVHSLNNEFKEEGDPEMFPAGEATVTIFKKADEKYIELKELTTNSDGTLLWETSEEGEIYFTVIKEKASAFYEGYRIAGLVTTSDELENEPVYITGTSLDYRYLGALIVVDRGSDGKIDKEDRFSDEYIFAYEDEDDYINDVVISDIQPVETDWEATYQGYATKLSAGSWQFVTNSYNLHHRLKYDQKVIYPALSQLDSDLENVWTSGYNFLHLYYEAEEQFERADCPQEIKKQWNENLKEGYKPHIAYVYWGLTNYFGDVPLVTSLTPPEMMERNKVSEIKDYLENLYYTMADHSTAREADAVGVILARFYLMKEFQDWGRAEMIYRRIIERGAYALSDDNPCFYPDPAEMILGGLLAESLIGPHEKYIHQVRYTEVVLGLAEVFVENGNFLMAAEYLNQVLQRRGEQMIYSSTLDVMREAVRDASVDEFEYEDKLYMFYKRWDTLLEEFRDRGVQSFNYVLPIPKKDSK